MLFYSTLICNLKNRCFVQIKKNFQIWQQNYELQTVYLRIKKSMKKLKSVVQIWCVRGHIHRWSRREYPRIC